MCVCVQATMRMGKEEGGGVGLEEEEDEEEEGVDLEEVSSCSFGVPPLTVGCVLFTR